MSKTTIVVGTQSGCGKTTIILALLQALKNKQISVQTFKAGPDFLDPFWHQAITAQASYNLDTKMMGAQACINQLHKHSEKSQITLIEGAMGLFDGATGVGELGSSAHLAKILDVSVILVVDAKGMSGSIVPLVSGFCDYATKLGFKISGIIANQVGSPHHAQLLDDLLTQHHLPLLIGWMKKNAPSLPERHLGLKRPEEAIIPDFKEFFHLDSQRLSFALTAFVKKPSLGSQPKALLKNKTIAIANDAACCFIYSDNIDCLKAQGANIHFFSPIKGESIPENTDALWLPGGYPELYAEELSTSSSGSSIKEFINQNKPVLAECGGAMLLGKNLIDFNGKSWKMAGIFPYTSIMKDRLVSLGYRNEENGMRGHEFHHSERINDDNLQPCFTLNRGDQGIRYKKVRASYIHWYFASEINVMAEWFL